jgi:hypothetical protein
MTSRHPDPSRGWFGCIVISKRLYKFKAMLMTGFIKPQTKVLCELKPVGLTGSGQTAHCPRSWGWCGSAASLTLSPDPPSLSLSLSQTLPHSYVGYPLESVGLKSAVGLYPARLQHV